MSGAGHDDDSRVVCEFEHRGRELQIDAPAEGDDDYSVYDLSGTFICSFQYSGDPEDHDELEEAAGEAVTEYDVSKMYP